MNNAVAKGAILIIVAEALLAMMAAMIKHLTDLGLPSEVVVFCRNAVGLIFMLPILLGSGGLGQIKTQRIGLHFIRAATGVGAMFCFFYTIAHATLAEAVLVKMTAPFFLPITAWLWLKEKISTQTWLAILVGFIGVAFILQPGTDGFNPVLIVALISAALMGVAKVSIRKMAETEPPKRVVFWFGFFSTLISAIPLFWAETLPGQEHLFWIIAIGATATCAQFAMTNAYQIASPGRIGVYNYTSVIWAASLGWIIWGETLGIWTIVGTLIIFIAGIWNLTANNKPKSA